MASLAMTSEKIMAGCPTPAMILLAHRQFMPCQRLFTLKPFADRLHRPSAAGEHSYTVLGNDHFIGTNRAFVFLSDCRHRLSLLYCTLKGAAIFSC